MEIRKIQEKDIKEVTSLYFEQINAGLLYLLGRAIGEPLFENMVSSKYGFCLCAIDENKLIGFAGCFTNPSKFFIELMRRKPCLFIKCIKRGSPAILKYLLIPIKGNASQTRDMGLIVREEYRGRGIWKALSESGFLELNRRDINKIYIYIQENNHLARRILEKFYKGKLIRVLPEERCLVYCLKVPENPSFL